MSIESAKVLKTLNPRKVWIPILLGVGFVGFMFYFDDELTLDKLQLIDQANTQVLLFGVLIVFLRDLGYVYRLRVLADGQLSWLSCIYSIILWEFASAVTPSVVGGTAVAIFILYKEGLTLGKAMAFAMLTAVFDNLFFVVAAPLALLFSGGEAFPQIKAAELQLGTSLEVLFYISYSLIAIYTLVMAMALFAHPRTFKWLLIKLTTIGFMRRWRHAAVNRGNEIILASRQLQGKKIRYWLVIALVTVFVWSARYATLNSLVEAFVPLNIHEHLLIFGRQIVMWITMLISPTPGSSGSAELLFREFFGRFLGDYSIATTILWRLFTYYPYLLMGAIVLPRWLRRVYVGSKHNIPHV